MKVLARRIKSLRKKFGYTQTQLSDMLGVSRAAVANWESGIRVPDSDTVANIAAIFQVNVDFLLGIGVNHCIAPENTVDVSMLNELGIKKVREFCNSLSFNDKYRAK